MPFPLGLDIMPPLPNESMAYGDQNKYNDQQLMS